VCLLGATVRRELFGSADPLGEHIRVGKFACQVIGMLAARGQSAMGRDQDDTVLMPLRTVQRRLNGTPDIGYIQVAVRNVNSLDTAKNLVTGIMRERRRIGRNQNDDFMVMDPRQLMEALTGTTRTMTTLLGAVAAVSLLVGGVGIMNIMLVSVTERTREIGIRLAIGALEREVLLQFLVEAVVLATLGGLAGIVLATIVSLSIAHAMNLPFVFTSGVYLLSFAFSALIGVLFGYFPARRAARLDPIDALRHE
jgi:putative ABC transport system permease protein